MKLALAVISLALAAAVPQAAVQAQNYQTPSITIPLPGVVQGPQRHDEGREGRDDRDRREHCAALENREHDLHARLERVGYGQEREHLEYQIRETHDQMRECRH